jgi:4a-hydroxytetrahydrobiopterin dehydratase
MPDLLTDAEIEERLRDSEWRREGDEIVRDWRFPDFARAMVFVNLVADAAEAVNHHPDILVHGWNRVRLSLTTHARGGLTASDFALAEQIDTF